MKDSPKLEKSLKGQRQALSLDLAIEPVSKNSIA